MNLGVTLREGVKKMPYEAGARGGGESYVHVYNYQVFFLRRPLEMTNKQVVFLFLFNHGLDTPPPDLSGTYLFCLYIFFLFNPQKIFFICHNESLVFICMHVSKIKCHDFFKEFCGQYGGFLPYQLQGTNIYTRVFLGFFSA